MSGCHLVESHYLSVSDNFQNPMADKFSNTSIRPKGRDRCADCSIFADFSNIIRAHWRQN